MSLTDVPDETCSCQAGGPHRGRAEEEGRHQEGLRLPAGAGPPLPAD